MNTFKHSGGYGDLIYGLPIVIVKGGGIFYLTQRQKDNLDCLLDIQPYNIKTETLPEEEWYKKEVTINLDKFREASQTSIAHAYLDVFKVDFDLSKKWLFNVPAKEISKIIIHDTGSARFPGSSIKWELLKGYEKQCIFIGYDCDYERFKKEKNLDIEWYPTKNLYEVAQVIEGSKLFLCNSSAPHAIAEALKKYFAIDIYEGKPLYPFSRTGYVVLTRGMIERALN